MELEASQPRALEPPVSSEALEALRERLRMTEAMLAETEALGRAGAWEWDLVRNVATWSAELYRIFGVCPDQFEPTYESFLAAVHPDDRDRVKQALDSTAKTGERYEIEYRIVRPDGEVRSVRARAGAKLGYDGTPVRLVGAARDVTEHRMVVEELLAEVRTARVEAMHDPLTGLPNRTLGLDRLEHAFAMAMRRHSDLAVLFVDVDGFKGVNDRRGHAAGDDVLRVIAERLRATARQADTVARIGGDEFLVVCEEGTGRIQALETAERLHDAARQPVRVGRVEETVEISIGVSAIGPRSLLSPEQLIREADEAMYEAKRSSPGGLALHGRR